MADLEQLTALARDAERAAAPDFDGVLARARTRRRRQRVTVAVAALAVVVGGAAVVTSLPDHARTSPPVTNHESPAPSPKPTTAQDRIRIALDRGTTELLAAADPDHVLIVRKYCPDGPRHCWWGSEVTGAPESRKPANQVGNVPVSAGVAGFLDENELMLIGLDGVRRVLDAGSRVPIAKAGRPSPDAVFAMADDGAFTLYEPSRHRWWSYLLGVTAPPIQSLLLTDDGTIWMQQDDGMRPAVISSSDDGGRTWTRHRLPREKAAQFGTLLWHAGTVGVPVYGHDGVLRSIQVLEANHWTDVPPDGPLSGLTGKLTLVGAEPNIAGLSDGDLFVRDNDFRVWQAAPDSWTRWSVVSRTSPVLALTGSRDVLLGVGDNHHTAFRWTGKAWQELR